MQISKELKVKYFKTPNGELDKFKSHDNISFKVIYDESKSVNIEIMNEWRIQFLTF